MTGRKPTFEERPDFVHKVCCHVERNMTPPSAFAQEGVNRNSWANYVKKANEEAEDDEPGKYSEFVNAVYAAKARGAGAAMDTVHDRMNSEDEAVSLRAATWILETVHREDYGKKQAVEVVVDPDTEIQQAGKRALAGLYASQDAIRAEEEAAERALTALAETERAIAEEETAPSH